MDDQTSDSRNREFVRLLAEHERRLSAYVHALIPRWQDAEDVLQNTKLRLWEQFDSFRPDGRFDAWAIAIAGYMVKTYRTQHVRQRVSFNDALVAKIAQNVPAASARSDRRMATLTDCVETLNHSARRLLQLFFSGHQRIKDIASELGQTPTATRVALFRVRRSLFECMERHFEREKDQ